MWQFAEAVAGIGEACRALDVPITGGNVSLYNETDGSGILPTPVIGVVGLLEDAGRVRSRVFPSAGLDIVLFGENPGELGGSEYLKSIHGLLRGPAPRLDLPRELALQRMLVDVIGRGLVESAHDCSEGGFAVALAECCFGTGGIGASVAVEAAGTDGGVDRIVATLFGESATRVIVSVLPTNIDVVLTAARVAGVPAVRIGQTGGSDLRVAVGDTLVLDLPVAEAEAIWSMSLATQLEGQVA